MRVISGALKGRRFDVPKGFSGRPTTDYARESLFNILQHQVSFEELDVLDLFCGAGGITYEFCSRGSKSVISVEKVFKNVQHIRQQLQDFGLANGEVLAWDVFEYLKKTPNTFDLIFADPPFELEGTERIVETVFSRKLLNPGGLLILEHAAKRHYETLPNFEESRSYGHVNFSFFRNSAT